MCSVGDMEFDRRAYTTGALSVLAQAGYLTLVQMHSEKKSALQSTTGSGGGSALEMVYLNSYNTLPLFVVASLLMGEISALWGSESYSRK